MFEDDELAYDPGDGKPKIYVSTEDGSSFYIGSYRPIYSLKKGIPRRTRPGTKGENAGWYSTFISPDLLRQALDLAISHSDLEENGAEVPYESVLRDYFEHNLSTIEPGLTFIGKEVLAGDRFIDILARDLKGALVVIEFKLSRGNDQVVGQIRSYIGWLREHKAEPHQKVRGIIIARKISDKLRYACSGQSDIKLMEYELRIIPKTV